MTQVKFGQQWLAGNKTMLDNGIHEYETIKSRYFDCMMSWDNECLNEIKLKSEQRKKDLKEKYNFTGTLDQFFDEKKALLANKTELLENGKLRLANYEPIVARINNILWIVLNCFFVLGGLIGASVSKIILEKLSCKISILIVNLFVIIASVLTFVSYYASSPVCLFIGRLLYGVQGGNFY